MPFTCFIFDINLSGIGDSVNTINRGFSVSSYSLPMACRMIISSAAIIFETPANMPVVGCNLRCYSNIFCIICSYSYTLNIFVENLWIVGLSEFAFVVLLIATVPQNLGILSGFIKVFFPLVFMFIGLF